MRKIAGTIALGIALALTGGAVGQARNADYDISKYFKETRMRVSHDSEFRVTANGKDDVYTVKVSLLDRQHEFTEIIECAADAVDDEHCEFYSINDKSGRSALWKRTKRGWVGTLTMGIYDGGVDQAYCDYLNEEQVSLSYGMVMRKKEGYQEKFIALLVPIRCVQ